MKIIKYIVVILIILVGLFFAVGFIHPVIPYGHEVTVNKPISEAWAVANDITKSKLWIEGLKSEDLIEGNVGEVGSKYTVTVNPGEGQEDFVMTETIVSKTEEDHITMHFDSDMMDFDQTITFRESDGKTNIKTDSKVKGKGASMRSLFALMEMFGGSFQKQEEKHINTLKKVIEENTTVYSAVDSSTGG